MSATRLILIGAAAATLGFSNVAWAQSAPKPDAAMLNIGKQLFISGATPACAICHTLKDAESEGAVGPGLDELKPSADQVAKAVREGLGIMPAFKSTLSEDQIKALAAYVSYVAGKP